LAAGELQAASALLLNLQQQAPVYQQAALDGIIQRLSIAAGNLPARPVLAAEDLEIAWQLLQAGLPGGQGGVLPAAETPASPDLEITPTPTPVP
jgi:hypothetical protein